MKKTVVLFVGLMLASSALAQKMDPFDAHVADYRILLNKKVQEEMGITTAQRTALNQIADMVKAKANPYLQQLQKQGKSQFDLEHDKTYLGYLQELHDGVLLQLKPAQLKRLRELSLQSVDIAGCMDVVVSKKIGMTPDELTKARKIYAIGVKKSSAIAQAVDRELMLKYKNTKVATSAEANMLNQSISKQRMAALKAKEPEIRKIEEQTKQSLLAVLTSKQIAAYHALQGKPFKP